MDKEEIHLLVQWSGGGSRRCGVECENHIVSKL